MKSELAGIFEAPRADVPQYLKAFSVEVFYTDTFEVDTDHREIVTDAVAELQSAFQLGFFAWDRFAGRDAATLTADVSDDGMTVHYVGDGVHHNAIAAVARLVLGLHHTPERAYEEARALFADMGEDTTAILPPRTEFSQTVRQVRLAAVEGLLDGPSAGRTDLLAYMADDAIGRPASGELASDLSETWAGDRLLVTGADFAEHGLGEMEDLLPSICASGCFADPAAMDESRNDEPSFFLRPATEGAAGEELVIDDYDGEAYGLLEVLNVLSGGRIGQLTVREED